MPVRRRKGEAGQAIILVVVAMSIFLLGAVGFGLDGSHLYAERQMAQAAADASAQAGIMSVFDGTNTSGAHQFSTASAFTCASNDAKTPCYYAQTLNGFNGASDTVTVTPNPAGTIPSLSASDPVNRLQVTVQRNVATTLMRLLGPTTSTISASATAAILGVNLSLPILVTHPTLSNALSVSGNGNVHIIGGSRQSVEVNSTSTTSTSVSGNALVDLSAAGPNGTGANFGVFAGPVATPSWLRLGSTGQYVEPSSPIQDPLVSIPTPGVPTNGIQTSTTGNGCPSGTCTLYSPGLYATGISLSGNTKALFKPGLYYLQSGGLSVSGNATLNMATGFGNDPNTGAGVVFYSTGTGVFSITGNGNVTLVGADATSTYKGILFFEDPQAAAQSHTIAGNGVVNLSGTIYINNNPATVTATHFQTLNVSGNGGSNTTINGEVITNKLAISGNGTVNMNLTANALLTRQVALVI